MSEDVIRVVVADDNAMVRYGLSVFMDCFADLKLVGEAVNGKDAIELCRQLQPDVVLMDLMMPQMDGVTATEIIHQTFPHIHVLVLTSTIDGDLIEAAMSAGAQGYLLKNVGIDVMAGAIRAAAE